MSTSEKNKAETYESVFERMLNSLAGVTMQAGDKVLHPLAGFNRSARHDFTISLLRGWAMIADIIRFYRDRITDEGYLATAVEDRSVSYLGQLLGYRKWPGEAAATWLALTVSSTRLPQESTGSGIIQIPAGGHLVVQNIPSSGAQPVIFESRNAVEARIEWNRLLPFTLAASQSPLVFDGMAGIRLAGRPTSLRPGSPLLIQTLEQSFFRIIDQVQPVQGAQFTLVTWAEPLQIDKAVSNQILSVKTFRQQAGFFGRKAPAWKTAPDSARQKVGTRSGGIFSCATDASAWNSIQTNLPPQPVQSLAVGSDNRIFAGTSNGLYSATHPGAEWSAMIIGLGQQNVQSLFVNDLGYLYAGGTRGSISFSTDGGQSWQSLRGPVNLGNGRLDRGHGLWSYIKRLLHIPVSSPAKSSSAPPSQTNLDGVIRALVECNDEKVRYLFAGTDRGVFFLRAGGLDWTTFNEGLPDYNSTTGLCSAAILALSASPGPHPHRLCAGTESGLYYRNLDDKKWNPAHLPGLSAGLKVFTFAACNQHLFAGTSQGLYASGDGAHWQQVTGQGLPNDASIRSLAAYHRAGAACLLAGTDQGAYSTCDGGANWKQLGCQELAVFCLNSDFSQALDRCDLSTSLRSIFSANGIDLPTGSKIKVIIQGEIWNIYDPLQNESLCFGFSLTREASSILVRQKIPLSNTDVRVVACLPTGEFLLAAPVGDFLESEWPNFSPCSTTIALDRIIGDLQPGSPIVLYQDQPEPVTVLATIESAEQRPIQAWGRQATVSVLTLKDIQGRLELLRQRDAAIYCKPAALDASALEEAAITPISGKAVTISGALTSLRKDMPVAVTGQPPTALLPAAGGIFFYPPCGTGDATIRQPSLTPFGLEQENILALTAGGGFYWAAVENAGIYLHREISSEDDHQISGWTPVNGAGAPTSAQCLLWSNGSLWAGTDSDHLYQCTQKEISEETATTIQQWTWTHDTSAPAGILALVVDSAGTLYAGTPDDGVFRKAAGEKNWTQLPSAIPLTTVAAFVIGPDKNVYVGAAQGVYHLDANGVLVPVTSHTNSQNNDAGLLSLTNSACNVNQVSALAFEKDVLYAGTMAGGIFFLSPQSTVWTSVSTHRLKSPVSSIILSSHGTIVAGTRGEGVCRLSTTDDSWVPIAYSASNDITALLTLTNGSLLAATGNAPILYSQDAVLQRAQRNPLFLASPAYAAMLDLQVVPPDLVVMFQRDFTGFSNPSVSTLRRGRSWIIRSGTFSFSLHMRNHGLPDAQIAVDQIDTFLALSREVGSAQRCTRWKLGMGFQSAYIKLSIEESEIFLCHALPDSKPVSEIAQIDSITLSESTEATQLNLKEPLGNLYDPNVTALNANLAYATQGVTIPLEVLGSGNAAAAHQSFQLRRPPVTYARNQPQDEVTCSLHIHVNSSSSPNAPPPSMVSAAPMALTPNGEIWRQAPSFFGASPEANVYTLTSDTDGNEIVQFGDGLQGSRLPTGVDNITATYRTELGTGGNLDAGSLIVFRKRPLGIRSVINPVPATNGTNPEAVATSRRRMKTWTCALDRIVSLQDYADFCFATPDILKAQVTQLETGSDNTHIHITLATIDRLPLDGSSQQARRLQQEIRASSARAWPFSLGGFTTLWFHLKAKVTIAMSGDQEAVRQSIAAALCDTFSFENRAFAQSVTATEVITTIQRIPGIQGIRLESLYLKGELPAYFAELVAQPARWNQRHKTILPAQLLLFDLAQDAANIEFVESG